MIQQISREQMNEAAAVIKSSFETVAKEFHITRSNAPKYVLYSITKEKLFEQYNSGRLMLASFENDKMVGFYSLNLYDRACELSNLCVLPDYRNKGIGTEMLLHAVQQAKARNLLKINISIVEENLRLRKWYEQFGFVHTHIKKYDFFPFTCGYMEYDLT